MTPFEKRVRLLAIAVRTIAQAPGTVLYESDKKFLKEVEKELGAL